MKRVIFEEEKETVNHSELKISDIVGFVENGGSKGYFVYVGDEKNGAIAVSAVSIVRSQEVPNMCYGAYENNKYKEIPYIGQSLTSVSSIREMYKFDTQKELHKWLSE